MAGSTSIPDVSPPRDEALPESYAIQVTDRHIHVWQCRASVGGSSVGWHFVETLARDDDPRLALEYAELTSPADDGYWVYSKSYDCTLDCD